MAEQAVKLGPSQKGREAKEVEVRVERTRDRIGCSDAVDGKRRVRGRERVGKAKNQRLVITCVGQTRQEISACVSNSCDVGDTDDNFPISELFKR
jgi:hypothetical protein